MIPVSLSVIISQIQLFLIFGRSLFVVLVHIYPVTGQRQTLTYLLLDNPHTFHYNKYFVIGRIRTCLGVFDNPMEFLIILWISSNFCPLNLLMVRSQQAEIIMVKRLIQGRNNVIRVWVEPRPFDQGHGRNDAVTHSASLPTKA